MFTYIDKKNAYNPYCILKVFSENFHGSGKGDLTGGMIWRVTVNIVIVGMDRLPLAVADCDTFANFVGKTSGLVPDVSVCEKNSVST